MAFLKIWPKTENFIQLRQPCFSGNLSEPYVQSEAEVIVQELFSE